MACNDICFCSKIIIQTLAYTVRRSGMFSLFIRFYIVSYKTESAWMQSLLPDVQKLSASIKG
jgi:hypothetical protein